MIKPCQVSVQHLLLQKAERGDSRYYMNWQDGTGNQSRDQPTDRWVDTLSGMSDPRELVPKNGSEKYLRILKLLLSIYYNPAQTAESFPVLCPWQCRSWAFLLSKQKLSTKNVLCCQMSQTTKDAVRVTRHGQAHAMPITWSLMQTCRVACSVYNNRRTREEKEKKAKKQRLKDRGKRGKAKEQRGPSCLWRGRSESRRTEKNLSVRNKRSSRRSCRWLGGSTLRESHKRQNRGAEIAVVQGLVEVVTSNWEDGISSKESEKRSQRKARSWLKARGNDEQLFCCPCEIYYKWQLNSSHTSVTILMDSRVPTHQVSSCLWQLYMKVSFSWKQVDICIWKYILRTFTILTVLMYCLVEHYYTSLHV